MLQEVRGWDPTVVAASKEEEEEEAAVAVDG